MRFCPSISHRKREGDEYIRLVFAFEKVMLKKQFLAR